MSDCKVRLNGLLGIVLIECIWIIRMFVAGPFCGELFKGKTEAKITGDIGELFALKAVFP